LHVVFERLVVLFRILEVTGGNLDALFWFILLVVFLSPSRKFRNSAPTEGVTV